MKLTQRQKDILKMIDGFNQIGAQITYPQVAKIVGYANSASARSACHALRDMKVLTIKPEAPLRGEYKEFKILISKEEYED